MTVHVLTVRNVNEALHRIIHTPKSEWIKTSPRGMETVEYPGTFITEYTHPHERVLFNKVRDANPFFHFMEALWILNGQRDVETLAKYNSQMAQFSDDGKSFHAPYGFRLRKHFDRWIETTDDDGQVIGVSPEPMDQIVEVIKLLRREPNTRRAVLAIWDPAYDLNMDSKDIPCNDLVMFKVREGMLNMTVCCRSNDAILGAYGANAVQFSFLQEFIARQLGVGVGTYRQVSDSFHIYTGQPQWHRLVAAMDGGPYRDPYERDDLNPYPICEATTSYQEWFRQLDLFMDGDLAYYDGHIDAFFTHVAEPIRFAWDIYKDEKYDVRKNARIDKAHDILERCLADDWNIACCEWLDRRRQ